MRTKYWMKFQKIKLCELFRKPQFEWTNGAPQLLPLSSYTRCFLGLGQAPYLSVCLAADHNHESSDGLYVRNLDAQFHVRHASQVLHNRLRLSDSFLLCLKGSLWSFPALCLKFPLMPSLFLFSFCQGSCFLGILCQAGLLFFHFFLAECIVRINCPWIFLRLLLIILHVQCRVGFRAIYHVPDRLKGRRQHMILRFLLNGQGCQQQNGREWHACIVSQLLHDMLLYHVLVLLWPHLPPFGQLYSESGFLDYGILWIFLLYRQTLFQLGLYSAQ